METSYLILIIVLIAVILGLVYYFFHRNSSKQEKSGILHYYTNPRCPHCTRFDPIWERFRGDHGSKISMIKHNVQEAQGQKSAIENGITHTPHLIFEKNGQKIPLSGPYTHEYLLKLLQY